MMALLVLEKRLVWEEMVVVLVTAGVEVGAVVELVSAPDLPA
jgi:hypothetical protein